MEFNHRKLQLVFLNSECLNSSENFTFVYFLLTPISKVKVNRMKSVLLCDCRFESIADEILICDYVHWNEYACRARALIFSIS